MQKIAPFRLTLIAMTIFITLLLAMAIGSVVVVPSWEELRRNIWCPEMQFSLKLSLGTALISTPLVMLFALPIGYAMSRFRFWGKGVVKTIINMPVAFPELVLGLGLLLVFGDTALGNGLRTLGLDFVFTKKGIVVAQFFTALPYAARILKSTFDYVNPRMEFVSRSLGYSMFETFLNVSLPLARHGILAAVVISFARCIGTFGTVLILAGGSYMKTEVLPVALYLNISYGNIDMALTSGIVLMAVAFAAIFVFERTDVHL